MTVQTERVKADPAAGAAAPARIPPGRPSKGRGAALAPYLLLLPALIATAVLLGWPLGKNLLISFQTLEPKQLIQHLTEWTGFSNYQEVLTSEEFWNVTMRSVIFTAVNVVLIMVLGTLVGLLLARLGPRLRVLLLFGLVLAWAMPVVAGATVFQWLFAQRFGVVNWVLASLGWESMADHNWYETQFSTFFVIILLIVWMSIPFVAINLYAATTTIPKELYEAAALDGAGAWRSFTSVTLPYLRPFLWATTFLEVIWVFKALTQVFAINRGGPDRLTEILPLYAFVEGYGNQHFGTGAAISFLTILVLLVITGYYLRTVLKQGEDEL
ncbi:sugar ABC transporter permease [Streptomyces sp. NPDC005012]|uniref:carbohydrate ABC transporter permease n=1 Tax=unclassified Streptomyces TaxID=2593676 RepID=UPI0033AAD16C